MNLQEPEMALEFQTVGVMRSLLELGVREALAAYVACRHENLNT